MKSFLIFIDIIKENKIIDIAVSDLLESKSFKFKEVKKTKFKILFKLKNLANFSKFQNVNINIRVIEFLIFKAK